jgi:hypothetical protein
MAHGGFSSFWGTVHRRLEAASNSSGLAPPSYSELICPGEYADRSFFLHVLPAFIGARIICEAAACHCDNRSDAPRLSSWNFPE